MTTERLQREEPHPLLGEVLHELRRISDLLESLPARMARPSARTSLPADDRTYLETLLPAVADAIGPCVWTTADLLAHAEQHEPIRHALDGRNGRRLGKLLARAEGVALADCLLRRGEAVREGLLWFVQRV